jgi:hypothetical protein
MKTLVVSLTLSHLGLLLMNYGVMELSLKSVYLFELLVHLELLISLAVEGLSLKLRDLGFKLLNVFHCLT